MSHLAVSFNAAGYYLGPVMPPGADTVLIISDARQKLLFISEMRFLQIYFCCSGHDEHLVADRGVRPDLVRHPDVLRRHIGLRIGGRGFGSLRRKRHQLEPFFGLPGVGRSLREPREVLR